MTQIPVERTLEERIEEIEKNGSPGLRKERGRQLAAYILIVTLAIVGFWQNNKRADENATAVTALCAQKDRLEIQVADTQDFLDHPEKYPQFNSPQLLRSIAQSQQKDLGTIKLLDNTLSCGTS